MEEAGLVVTRDGVGNLVGRLPGEEPGLPEVWTGSHLDSVPEGGKFDGALGVVAGLEAVQRLGRRPRTLGVVVFRAEETGCQGSRAYVQSEPLPGAFVEVHVEQGRRLDTAGAALGVVGGIAGYLRRMVTFEGVAGHAGTSPMADRDDALVKAAGFILRARDAARDDAVATVGQVEVQPGAVNVIPGSVTVSLDVRAADGDRLEELVRDLGVEPEPRNDPIPMDAGIRAALAEELAQRGMPRASSSRGRAMTPACWRRPACRAGCSSSAASPAGPAIRRRSTRAPRTSSSQWKCSPEPFCVWPAADSSQARVEGVARRGNTPFPIRIER